MICAKYGHNPGQAHLKAAKRILRYLSGTRTHRISYGPNPHTIIGKSGSTLVGLVDSDWASDKDKRRSTTGFVFYLNGGPVNWKSRLQKCIAQSSAEAEYIAASESSKVAVWLQRLSQSLPSAQPLQEGTLVMHCDNQAALAIIKNPICSSKTKHVELRYHLVRDYVTRKLLKFQYIPTEENIADIFTKPLDKSIFEKHRDSLLKKPPLDSSELDTNQAQVQENANASS